MIKRLDAEAREVLSLAEEEALDIGHGWVGTEHLLLGLLRSVGEGRVESGELRRVLERPSLARAREIVLELLPPDTEGRTEAGAAMTPRAGRVLGHSATVAADTGAGFISVAHLLLGLLWEVKGIGARILDEYGLSYGSAADALGVSVSRLPDPPDDRPFGSRVDVSLQELEILLRELPGMIPPGSPLAFNLSDDDRAWVCLGENLDAEAYVREALARP